VLSYDDVQAVSPNYFQLPKKFNINDTIALLRLLKDKSKIYVVNVNSVMNAISATLNIPELVLQIFNDDEALISYTFDNAFLVTPKLVDSFPVERQYLVSTEEFIEKNQKFYYSVECVIRGLRTLIESA
jgi:hypothetical protein